MKNGPLLEVENLKTHFFTKVGVAKAVDGVSFSLAPGEVMGLVGESGSGKSVTGFSLMGLVDPPGRIVDGRIMLQGKDIARYTDKKFRRLRGSKVAMIFQDPLTTLNPMLRIDTQMIEAIRAHRKVNRSEARTEALQSLKQVGIAAAEKRLNAYPHQFSGGMRQRVAIAIALANRPDLIIADEPTTALDVTIQSQILYEIQKLTREKSMSLIWITHDLTVVAGLADKISVMYAGRIVEQGSINEVLDSPLHPYTKGLIDSVPSRNRRGTYLNQIPGTTPSLLNLKPGCPFRDRCSHSDQACLVEPTVTSPIKGRFVRCFHPLSGGIL